MHLGQWILPKSTIQPYKRRWWQLREAETDLVDDTSSRVRAGDQRQEGAENTIANHLSRLEKEPDPIPIRDEFPDEQIP
ncbi:hypothetical protein CR513_02914, partial [Mucuna pruriens]